MTNPRTYFVIMVFLACGCTDRRPKDKDKVPSVGGAADINLIPKEARTKEQEAELRLYLLQERPVLSQDVGHK